MFNSIYLSIQTRNHSVDESWLDVTASWLLGDAKIIADNIREQVYQELGLYHLQVLFNKIFAKMGSDYKKPNAIQLFQEE